MKLYIVRRDDVDAIWPLINEYIKRAVNSSLTAYTVGYLWHLCRSNNVFLMVGEDDGDVKVAAVFRFETWGGEQVFNCICLAGDGMENWLADVVAYAKQIGACGGASKLVTNGRKGWQKMIDGLKPIYTAFELEI